jgi:excisionase family DNA binding protein
VNKLWTPQEVAKHWRVDLSSVYRWIRAGRIYSLPMGRTYRIPDEEVQRGVPRQ